MLYSLPILRFATRKIKLIIDFVINHCSADHDWFEESVSPKNNLEHVYFIWRPPRVYEINVKANRKQLVEDHVLVILVESQY
ncbi:BDM_1a_G0025870.mRNA.1.CDS.1 [Saccharomyces cerevisiae]|nr:BDM_1a_G0025870.mRNA.1.CDS.1 [Saccharomyces cerevisiae]CAI7167120.1 BDM_1a_G0025870.mRNA.1.CDS.1 [Saccharomyces cerevisiae]